MVNSTSGTYLKSLVAVLLIFMTASLHAQQTSIQDYVIFGGNVNCKNSGISNNGNNECMVIIGNKSKIKSGAIGSYQFIKTTGEVNIGGNLVSGGIINLADKNTIGGRISASNSFSFNGQALQTGSNGNLIGNIDVNGNIFVGGGSKVNGKVTHPERTMYKGPVPTGGNVTGSPTLALLPPMPEVTRFPNAGSQSLYGTETVKPGAYDKIKLPGNKTLTFSGTGEYTFNSINNRDANTFIFDFKNNSTGTFKLYIYGDVDLDNITVKTINGGDASVFMQKYMAVAERAGIKDLPGIWAILMELPAKRNLFGWELFGTFRRN